MGIGIQPEIQGGRNGTQGLERRLRICFLANAADSHTVKWLNHFSALGHEVHILSFETGPPLPKSVRIHRLGPRVHRNLRYFLAARQARRLVLEIRPDILHAHEASGYGTLGRLVGFHPYVLSTWGSDILDVPLKSALYRMLVRANFQNADHVCSTSEVMARQALELFNRVATVTPFGVDCERFRPLRVPDGDSREFVVGTVKKLKSCYGIEYLIRGFALFTKRHRENSKMRLVIAGDGSLRGSLQRLTKELGVEGQTNFLGTIPQEQIPEVLGTFSVFAALSLREGFGVAVLEASACELPVVVTNVDGLPEVVRAGVTGLMVPPRDAEAAGAAFSTLFEDAKLRRRLGAAGREFVLQNYQWSENAGRMERVYRSILARD
jgi:L-malate glycosyltransferase